MRGRFFCLLGSVNSAKLTPMIKEFLMKQMLKRQGVSDEQINQLINIVEQNPALFKKIAEEIKVKVASGQDEQSAAIAVMQAHQEELKNIKV